MKVENAWLGCGGRIHGSRNRFAFNMIAASLRAQIIHRIKNKILRKLIDKMLLNSNQFDSIAAWQEYFYFSICSVFQF